MSGNIFDAYEWNSLNDVKFSATRDQIESFCMIANILGIEIHLYCKSLKQQYNSRTETSIIFKDDNNA